jgi:Cro/C1-type HTH DNA-binding domain
MDAAEAKNLRRANGNTTLADRIRRDPERARRIDHYRDLISIEEQVLTAMAERHMTPAQLARRLDRPASTITRDLKGGLSEAKLGRLRRYAEALGYELIVLLEPRREAPGTALKPAASGRRR